jgi:hypothetical protein
LELEKLEQLTDLMSELCSVSHLDAGVDPIAIATPDPSTGDVAGVIQIGHDPLRGPLGDPDALGDISQPDTLVARDAQEHLGVICHERPGGIWFA